VGSREISENGGEQDGVTDVRRVEDTNTLERAWTRPSPAQEAGRGDDRYAEAAVGRAKERVPALAAHVPAQASHRKAI
jgi:hypothetical protein